MYCTMRLRPRGSHTLHFALIIHGHSPHVFTLSFLISPVVFVSSRVVHMVQPSSGKGDREQDTMDNNVNDNMEGVTNLSQLFAESNIHTIPPERIYKATPEERTEALQDMHGVSDTIQEEANIVEAKLRELDILLATFGNDEEERQAYDEAVRRNPEYVRSMRLAFLRGESFDVSKTRTRMFAHFTTRLSLFQTPDVLGRDIGLADLKSENDKFILKNGMIQLLPHEDRSGRAILFMYPYQEKLGTVPFDQQALLRVFFWMITLAANRGSSAQQKGMIFIWYGLGGKFSPLHKGRSPRYFDLLQIMPIRTVSIHACYNDSFLTEAVNEVMAKSASKYVFRIQSHCGNHIKCRYSMMSYGIPLGILPVNSDGSVQMTDHEELLARIRVVDAAESSSSCPIAEYQESSSISSIGEKIDHAVSSVPGTTTTTLPPGPMDVVLGRGQRGTKLPGNMLLKRLLEERYETYNNGSRTIKRAACQDIYDLMHQAGCRFLDPAEPNEPKSPYGRSKPPEAWVELQEPALALKRIAHKFRNLRQRKQTG